MDGFANDGTVHGARVDFILPPNAVDVSPVEDNEGHITVGFREVGEFEVDAIANEAHLHLG